MVKIVIFAFMLLFSPVVASASSPVLPDQDASTTEVATSQPGDPADAATTEEIFLEKDETLLQHEYIDTTYTVVTNRDIYLMLVKIYNLLLFFLWTVIAMYVINRVFEAFRPAYKVSKE